MRKDGITSAPPLSNGARRPSPAPAERILVVDDDDELRRTIARTLRKAEYAVQEAPDGVSAVALLEQSSFDVIVSDISMPHMSGLELLRAVRGRDLDVPVILMTANASVETAVEAVHYGAMRYLLKPFEPQALLEAVERATQLVRLARLKRDALILLGKENKLLGDRASLEAGFTRAVSGIWMAYQPIVSWSHKSVYSYEALVRSTEPNLQHPGLLFDAAERLDALHTLGRAIRAAVAATDSAPHCLFVNLHTRDLADPALFAATGSLTAIAERVVLEITERASLDEVPDLAARIDDLRRMGFRIAVDDLGAGYAGLTSFMQLKPDVVKLDMSLIRDVDRDEAKQRLVGSMIALCRDLKMLAVVEGVETVAERDTLVRLGADLFQGYLFAKPGRPFPAVQW